MLSKVKQLLKKWFGCKHPKKYELSQEFGKKILARDYKKFDVLERTRVMYYCGSCGEVIRYEYITKYRKMSFEELEEYRLGGKNENNR